MIAEDGLRGLTSNPSIFEKAIVGTNEYEAALRATAAVDWHPWTLYEVLAIRDIQTAADPLRPVYLATGRADGYASLEVSPLLAYDTDGTIKEARRVWQAIGRDNAMIKVPASREGWALLFAVDRYQEVARAYSDGLSMFARAGGDVATVSSVASFFVIRASLAEDLEDAHRVIDSLDRFDISLTDAANKLVDDGVAIFSGAFERLLASVRARVGANNLQAAGAAAASI